MRVLHRKIRHTCKAHRNLRIKSPPNADPYCEMLPAKLRKTRFSYTTRSRITQQDNSLRCAWNRRLYSTEMSACKRITSSRVHLKPVEALLREFHLRASNLIPRQDRGRQRMDY